MAPPSRDLPRKKPPPTSVREALRTGFTTEREEHLIVTDDGERAHSHSESSGVIREQADRSETAPFDLSETEAQAWRQRQAREDVHELARGVGQIRIDMNAGFASHNERFATMTTVLEQLVTLEKARQDAAREAAVAAATERREIREAAALANAEAVKQRAEVAKIEATGKWSFREKMMATSLGIVGAAVLALIGLLAKR